MQRGYILTQAGLEKVENFISVENKMSRREISANTCLDRATVTKTLHGERPVNLRTIRTLFLSLGIPLENMDYCKVSSTKEEAMGQNKDDYNLLIQAAENTEKLAENEHDTFKKEKLLSQAQQFRDRAENLPKDPPGS